MNEDNDFQAEFPSQSRNPAQMTAPVNYKQGSGTASQGTAVKAPAVVPVI